MAEPVREAGRADAGVVAGNQSTLICDFQAVVGRVDIGHDVPRIVGRAQEALDELVPPARMLRAEVWKKSMTSASPQLGAFDTSTTTWAPASASASPLPVMMSTPVAGDAASGSWPAARSLVTSFEPIRPVPPITTIFILFPFGFVSVGLSAASLRW